MPAERPPSGWTRLSPSASWAVRHALSAPGEPLDPSTLASVQPVFGRDLGQVRVHTDAAAAQSARAVEALAYTVGRDIVFGAGRYSPSTDHGRRVLTHELAHVAQAHDGPAGHGDGYLVSDPAGPTEREAETVAARRSFVSARQAPRSWVPLLQRLTSVPTPDYAQRGDTCQPASMISALITWDRENAATAKPNENMVGLTAATLLHMDTHKAELIAAWSAGGKDGKKDYDDQYAMVTKARADLSKAGSAATEPQYQDLGTLLSRFGADSDSILSKLGLKASARTAANSLNDIFASPALTGLKAGQTAQIEWYVNTTSINSTTGQASPSLGYHMFLVGLSQAGTWFLSDQGNNPPLKLEAASLADLRKALDQAAASGKSWIVTDPSVTRIQMTWTGVHVLESQDYDAPFRALVPSGSFLAEVDEGTLTIGDRIHAWDFLARYDSFAECYPNFLVGFGGGHGGLVIEEPAGIFTLFKTSPVSDANFDETSIDQDDSKDGLLGGSHRFAHAWLMLGTAAGRKHSPFQVY